MEYRRLQSTGGSSLTVTLPKAWIQQTKLKTQDRVYTRISGSRLIITPEYVRQTIPVVTVHCTSKTPCQHIIREIIAGFISGADTVYCTTSSTGFTAEQAQCVQDTVASLFGFEIIASSAQSFTLKNILDRNKLSTLDTLKQVAEITNNMFKDACTALLAHDKKLASSVLRRDKEVDGLNYILKRHFNRVIRGILYDTLVEVTYSRSISIQLERIADHAVHIATLVSDIPDANAPEVTQVCDALIELMNDALQLIETQSTEAAHVILDKNKQIDTLISTTAQLNSSYNGARIQNSFDRIRGYVMNIAETTIDTNYTKSLGD